MVNKLVDPRKKKNDEPSATSQITAQQAAKSFVASLDTNKLNRFRKMVNYGVSAGESVANHYGVTTDEFMREVKKILK